MTAVGIRPGRSLLALVALLLSTLGGGRAPQVGAVERAGDDGYVDSAEYRCEVAAAVVASRPAGPVTATPAVAPARSHAVAPAACLPTVPGPRRGSAGGARAP